MCWRDFRSSLPWCWGNTCRLDRGVDAFGGRSAGKLCVAQRLLGLARTGRPNAFRRASSVAHRRRDAVVSDVALDDIAVGDTIVIYPHDICPVDGTVMEGNGVMNEAFLTGEPFEIPKAPGSGVISGAVNGGSALTIAATRRAVDSRYAKIMEVMRESEQNQPRLRRLGDQLGAIYTPVAVAIAIAAWMISGETVRFLAVLVIATPCPLLIAIPIAIIGSISPAARRSIIIKNSAVLEQISSCRVAIFDKTGTLTYGEPALTEQLIAPGFALREVLALAASLELDSKHSLGRAILVRAKAENLSLQQASEVGEAPGQGLRGTVAGRRVEITSRGKLVAQNVPRGGAPSSGGGRAGMCGGDRRPAGGDLPPARRTAGRRTILYAAPRAQASIRPDHDRFRGS